MYITATSTSSLRLGRAMILARHDHGAIAPGVFGALKNIEIEISWREHRQQKPPHRVGTTRPSRPIVTAN
jgi:hypothetical protein